MKESTLELIRENFRTGEKLANTHNSKVKRLKEQLQEPKVLEFITDRGILIPKADLEEMTEEDVLDAVISNYSPLDRAVESNEVYFCTGSIIREINVPPFKEYIDLEDELESLFIPLTECDRFEANHTVVYGKNYRETQKEFLLCMIKEGQEKAVKTMVKKYYKK